MQRARLKRLDRFKATSNAVLVATDVAGRGLDIKGVEFVVNYQVAHRAPRNATQCATLHNAPTSPRRVLQRRVLQRRVLQRRVLQRRVLQHGRLQRRALRVATACAATRQVATSRVATGAALLRRLRAPRGPHCSDPPRRPDRALPFPLSAIPT
jgi:hypothetical protein